MFVFLIVIFFNNLISLSPSTQVHRLHNYLREEKEGISQSQKDWFFYGQSKIALQKSPVDFAQLHQKKVIEKYQESSVIVSDIDDTLIKEGEWLVDEGARVLIQMIQQGKRLAFISDGKSYYPKQDHFISLLSKMIIEEKMQEKCHQKIAFVLADKSLIYDADKQGFILWQEHQRMGQKEEKQVIMLEIFKQMRHQREVIRQSNLAYQDIIFTEESLEDTYGDFQIEFDKSSPIVGSKEEKERLISFMNELQESVSQINQKGCLITKEIYDGVALIGVSYRSKYQEFKILENLWATEGEKVMYFGDQFMSRNAVLADSSMIGYKDITCVSATNEMQLFWQENEEAKQFQEERKEMSQKELTEENIANLLVPVEVGDEGVEVIWELLEISVNQYEKSKKYQQEVQVEQLQSKTAQLYQENNHEFLDTQEASLLSQLDMIPFVDKAQTDFVFNQYRYQSTSLEEEKSDLLPFNQESYLMLGLSYEEKKPLEKSEKEELKASFMPHIQSIMDVRKLKLESIRFEIIRFDGDIKKSKALVKNDMKEQATIYLDERLYHILREPKLQSLDKSHLQVLIMENEMRQLSMKKEAQLKGVQLNDDKNQGELSDLDYLELISFVQTLLADGFDMFENNKKVFQEFLKFITVEGSIEEAFFSRAFEYLELVANILDQDNFSQINDFKEAKDKLIASLSSVDSIQQTKEGQRAKLSEELMNAVAVLRSA